MQNKALMKSLIPALIIVPVFLYNRVLGLIALTAFVLYSVIRGRSVYYEILANQAYRKGDVNKAIMWLEKACKSSKLKPVTTISYGYLLLKTGNIEEAQKILDTLLRSNIDNDSMMQAKSNYALILWKKGQLKEAVDMLSEVYDSYKNTTIYGSLGYLLILQGDLEKALEFNKEAHEYNDSSTIILDNLGYTYYKMGDFKNSEEIYEKLLSLNPSFPEAYYNYSRLQKDMGNHEKALEMAQKAKGYRLSYLSNLTEEELDSYIKELQDLMSIST